MFLLKYNKMMFVIVFYGGILPKRTNISVFRIEKRGENEKGLFFLLIQFVMGEVNQGYG